MIKIRAYGIPAPQGSKKSVGKGYFVEASARVMPWRESVKEATLRDYDGEPLSGAVEVSILFLFPRPKKHFGTGKNANKLKANAPVFVIEKIGVIWKSLKDQLMMLYLNLQEVLQCLMIA